MVGLSVVVLGGTGFLGRHIGAAFAALGARVHPVARSLGHAPARDGTVIGMDLLEAEPGAIAELVRATGADVVVNAAGQVWHGTGEQMAAGNAVLVERLVAVLAELPGPPVRLVQLGSVHEYGAGAVDAPTGEDHVPTPVTAYGRSKLLGTRAVLRAAAERGVDGVVLRLANVIGAGVPEGSLFGRVAAHLGAAARAAARGEQVADLRLPPLSVARDLVDARDAAAAALAAATTPGAVVTGQVINVGRGEAISMSGLVRRMVSLSGLAVPVVEQPVGHGARSDVAWQRLDITSAERLLGWRPRRDLDDSLRDLLAGVMPPGHPPLGAAATTSDRVDPSR
ncbi:nucleoside-diphosphate-sugar epimerase [Actinokineospora cianjurensis]|uniref:Nucleoside-diphosphate-sugar epimerase n=1 Tax=Actinokineospora cianjurensis TaxID=585224 RepID=A0A421AV71_9PSEU|nr:nucleoside-diphosphate-sugar epimerase [Actinokineospora cianjurensis]